MKVTATQLKELKSPFATFVAGDTEAEAYRPWPPEIAPPGALVYVSTHQQLEAAIEIPAGIIIATTEIAKTKVDLAPNQALFATPAINASMALINPNFDKKATRWPSGISPQASIHPSATLGKNVSVGAFSVIGSGVHIGDDSIISPHCVVENEAHLGNKVILHPFVCIGSESEIGNNVEINSHTTVGSDGFGYVTEPKQKNHYKVPQLGKVIIEDDVEIGSGCSIDRATLHETRIGQGTKMDNQIHVAHNCKIGRNCLLAAKFAMAGSSTLGDNVTCAGGVLVSDHVNVTDNVVVGGNSAVTKDVTTSGMYLGYPLQPWREGLKTLASLSLVPELRKEVTELKKIVNPTKP